MHLVFLLTAQKQFLDLFVSGVVLIIRSGGGKVCMYIC